MILSTALYTKARPQISNDLGFLQKKSGIQNFFDNSTGFSLVQKPIQFIQSTFSTPFLCLLVRTKFISTQYLEKRNWTAPDVRFPPSNELFRNSSILPAVLCSHHTFFIRYSTCNEVTEQQPLSCAVLGLTLLEFEVQKTSCSGWPEMCPIWSRGKFHKNSLNPCLVVYTWRHFLDKALTIRISVRMWKLDLFWPFLGWKKCFLMFGGIRHRSFFPT